MAAELGGLSLLALSVIHRLFAWIISQSHGTLPTGEKLCSFICPSMQRKLVSLSLGSVKAGSCLEP